MIMVLHAILRFLVWNAPVLEYDYSDVEVKMLGSEENHPK